MHRRLLAACLGLASLSSAHAQQTAGEVYQWKDANGVTHYSQTPPPKGSYQQRLISTAGAAATQPTPAAVARAEQNPQCTTARGNIAALQGEGRVQQDSDGDGKPDKILSDQERADQLALAQAAEKAYCTP